LFGLLEKEGEDYRLTPRGVFYYYRFESFYTLAYIDRMWNVMRNNPFPKKLTL
jgi:oxygen-independent coproporphyrinogen-3 oxidase